MSIALATKGIICISGFSQGTPTYYYYCVDLPEILAANNISSSVEARTVGIKIVMDDLGPHAVVDNLVAEESIEDLIPKLSIKD